MSVFSLTSNKSFPLLNLLDQKFSLLTIVNVVQDKIAINPGAGSLYFHVLFSLSCILCCILGISFSQSSPDVMT